MAWEPTEKDQIKHQTNGELQNNEGARGRRLFTYKSSAKLVQHPMLGRIEPLQVLLQSPSLDCKIIMIRKAQHILIIMIRKAQHILIKCYHMQHILISSVVK
jgi:hypothetical protein